MNLPNYFIADLPPEATLAPAMLQEACLTLKRNRGQYLAARSTDQLVKILCEVADGWLQADNLFRKLALSEGPAKTGFPRATLEKGLDHFFRQFTHGNFRALLSQDLGDAHCLDRLCRREDEAGRARMTMAVGPELLVHICPGNIPNPTLMSMVLGLLTRSAQFVKCARGSAYLPRLFAHSIYDCDRKLGACLELAEWRGGHAALEEVLFAEADGVTATGSDETLAAIRAKLPIQTRFLGYGHRVSFGYVTKEVWSGCDAKRIAVAATEDVIAWNQLGCLSPHVIYVQTGGAVAPQAFAGLLATGLEQREEAEPRGELSAALAAGIASRRGIYEVRAAHLPDTCLWQSKDSTAWTVVYEADPRFQTSCLHRFVYVKPAKDLPEVLRGADAVRGKVSTVGLAAPENQTHELAVQLARWGATRVCPLGQMQKPPLTWRHDGRPCLADLVTWTDVEQ